MNNTTSMIMLKDWHDNAAKKKLALDKKAKKAGKWNDSFSTEKLGQMPNANPRNVNVYLPCII